MPVFTIETPNGVLDIEAADEQGALAGAQQWASGQAKVSTPSVVDLSSDWDLGSEVLNGVTFGTLPNIQAGAIAGVKGLGRALGMDAGTSLSSDYDAELNKAQADRRAYRQAHPFWAAAGNVAGGVLTGAGAAKAGATIVGRMPSQGLSNLLPRTVAGAGEGAAYGAAAGFGGGEGSVENRLQGAKDAILPGLVAGAAAPAVIDVAGKVGGVARDWYTGWRAPQTRADELLVQSIMRDKATPTGSSPSALAAAVDDAKAAGQPDFMVADAGGTNLQKTLKRAARTPGEFRDTATRTVDARQMGQGARISGFVDDALGTKGDSAYATEQALLQGRRAAAEPLYEQAYKAPTPTDPFYTSETLGRDSVQRAMSSAERVAAEKQIPVSELYAEVPNPAAKTVTTQKPSSVLGPDGAPVMQAVTETVDPTVRVPTVRGWDFIKRELDAMVTQLYKSGDTTQAEAVKATRNALRDRLGADIPEYGQALARYSDDSASLEAIEAGRQLAKAGNPDEAKAIFGGLNPGQQSLARTGAAREMQTPLQNRNDTADKTLLFSNPNSRGKMDVLAEDPAARQVFADRIGREQSMAKTRNVIKGGSDTAENLSDASQMADTGFWSALFSGRPMVAGGRMLEGAARMAAGMNEDTARFIGEALMTNDTQKILSLADMFAKAQQRAAQPITATTKTITGATAPLQGKGRSKERQDEGREPGGAVKREPLRLTITPEKR